MSNRITTIKRIPTTEENGFIEVSVSYSKGGVNFATYKNEKRGYWLHVQPLTIQGNWVQFTGFSGVKQFVKEANRFSQKQLEAVAEECKTNDIVQHMIDSVCQKKGIEVKEEVTA